MCSNDGGVVVFPATVSVMSPRARVSAVVAVVAVAASAGVVGIAALDGGRPAGTAPAAAGPRPGTPPLSIDLGVRTDPEAVALRQALAAYDRGERARAERLFRSGRSLEARVGEAFARWPDGTLPRLTQLSGLYPRSALVQLSLGMALYWARRPGAQAAWRQAAQLEPDSAYAVAADNLLYPRYARNVPIFVPAQPAPAAVRPLAPPAQLRLLERLDRRGDRLGSLYYGIALQRLGRQRSAEQVLARLAARRPGDAEAQAAVAVARFDKAAPAAAFSRLGPLVRRFPRAATVRFHLGLLLLWSGELRQARRQLLLARSVQPGSPLAREAQRYLAVLAKAGG